MCLVPRPYCDVLNPLYLGRLAGRCFWVIPSMVVVPIVHLAFGHFTIAWIWGMIITLRKLCIFPSKVNMQDLAPWVLLKEASSRAYLGALSGGFLIQQWFGPWIYCDHLGLLQILISPEEEINVVWNVLKVKKIVPNIFWLHILPRVLFSTLYFYMFLIKYIFYESICVNMCNAWKIHLNLDSYVWRHRDVGIHVKGVTTWLSFL